MTIISKGFNKAVDPRSKKILYSQNDHKKAFGSLWVLCSFWVKKYIKENNLMYNLRCTVQCTCLQCSWYSIAYVFIV